MAIVRMKNIRLLALEKDRESLLELFQRLGCVQVDSQSEKLSDPEWDGLITKPKTALEETRVKVGAVKNAIEALGKYAGIKDSLVSKLFTARPEVTMPELLKDSFLTEMTGAADEILECSRHISALTAEWGRVENRMTSLFPWKDLDIPLDLQNTSYLNFSPGICPATTDINEMRRLLAEESAAELFLISRNDNECYLSVLYHPGTEEETAGVLKAFGFSRMDFKDFSGTAAENIEALRTRLKEIEVEREAAKKGLIDFAPRINDLRQAFDALTVRMQREEAAEKLLISGSVFVLEGWAPEQVIPSLEKLLNRYECAYESRSPEPGEEPPVMLRTEGPFRKIVEPLNMVTEMYSLPKYGNIDPNPLITPFYILFFGMMYADVAYGLILLILGYLVTKKSKPKGMMGYAFRLMQSCGLSAIIFGFIFGGFFSDIVTVVGATFFNAEWAFPTLWISPTDTVNNGPMTVLIFSMVLGAIQIIAGMIIKGYLLIRDGHPVAAVMEVIPWWCFFGSIAGTVLTGSAVWVIAGLALIVLTQGYKKKGIFGKLFGGVAALYDITGYLGDILSYSRLMALGLAGGVVGSVFNKLGSMPGSVPVAGPIIFLVIFLAGHAFNFSLNIIGTFVHAARLQYIEYFSKFYDSPGNPFRPLRANTKYVDVVEKSST